MKFLRIWLLVLLAIVLPLRGALAMALPCGAGPAHVHTGAHGSHGAPAQDVHHAAPQDTPAGHDAAGKCSFCASCCAVAAPALASFHLPVAAPVAARFAEPQAPAAEFLATGPERPPRGT